MVGVLAVALACAALLACAPAPDHDAPLEPAPAAAAPLEGPLRLLAVDPPPGSLVTPQVRFALRFDRPLAPASASGALANCAYPDPRAEFIADPFRLTSTWLDATGTVLYVKPPELLPGRDVVLYVREALRAADGTRLEHDPAVASPGMARAWSYRVLELPP